MTDKIIARKSRANAENIVFLGFEEQEGIIATQVVSWAKMLKPVEEVLKTIKDKKLKGTIQNGQFKFDPNGLEIVVQ